MADKHILVVEDDDSIRCQLKAVLIREGYQPRTAETCSDGLALALEQMPSLLVLDLSLPDGTGWGLLEDIRRARPDQDPLVLVMSSNRVSRAQLREQRVHRFFAKPFDMSSFVETVRELMAA